MLDECDIAAYKISICLVKIVRYFLQIRLREQFSNLRLHSELNEFDKVLVIDHLAQNLQS